MSAEDTLEGRIEASMSFAQTQLEHLAMRAGPQRFVAYTNTEGQWDQRTISNWCCSFPIGLFWMMYDYTEEAQWVEYAMDWAQAVEDTAVATDNDTGFQVFGAYGYGFRHASDALSEETVAVYEEILHRGTKTFDEQRYNPTVGCYRSWPGRQSDPKEMPFEVNIDQLMNMELPLYVATETGDDELLERVVSHADRTWENSIFKTGGEQWPENVGDQYVPRKHGSHWHVVGYDVETGEVVDKRQEQGAIDESTWSRGQSWAVYGYVMIYRYTGLERMLERSEVCFDYFMEALTEQSGDFVAYSDFDMPVDANHPLDTSASAIVASAVLELFEVTGEVKYLEAAQNILNDLTTRPYLADGTSFESILTRGSERYSDEEDLGSIFGDHYFVEAMLRYEKLRASGLLPHKD